MGGDKNSKRGIGKTKMDQNTKNIDRSHTSRSQNETTEPAKK